MDKKFNHKRLEKLNNPKRLKSIPPNYIWNKINIGQCKTIVDIGAGTGLFSKAFSEIMGNGTVYALDISDAMVRWMQKNISNDNNGITPLIMSETKIPLEDELSDLVLMITLYHELNSPEILLAETLRILKKGGKICVIDWKKEKMSFGPSLEIRSSVDEISSQLEASGFCRIQTDTSLERFNMVWAEKNTDI
ncbi:MAG TPA: class I SAM-dependent methyltransferase [Clostridia bacterium]|nr:class I SAM-dependent methyltransferase [Clostridia bacterium]